MTTDFVIYICREMLSTGIIILLPVLGAAMVVGLIISVFQAVTQINEMTLTFVPKIAIVGGVVFFLLPWFLEILMGFMMEIFNQIQTMTM